MTINISLFEYIPLPFSELPENAQVFFADNDFVDGLERFLANSNFNKALSFSRKAIHPTSFVGVIRYKNIQFEILPKLLSKSESDKKQILKNLLYMLSYTNKLDIKDNNLANLHASNNPFLETLIKIYAETLFSALKRFSPKNYINISDNINFFKGRLNISRNIRHNYANKAKFFCDFDEFSENNVLNQLFLYVTYNLNNVTKNTHNKKLLQCIINYYSDIDFVRFYPKDLSHITLTKNQSFFKTAFLLAKMFIEHTAVDMSKNKFDNIALLWDMNSLFEEFVTEFLQRNKNEIGLYEVKPQYGRRLLKSKDNNKYYSNTFVDIYIVKQKGKPGIVLDTKYKINDGEYGELSNADVFQVTTYCRLWDSSNAVLLYPSSDNSKCIQNIYNLNVHDNVNDLEIKTAHVDISTDLSTSKEYLIQKFREII